MTALWRRFVPAMIVMALAAGLLALVWRPLGSSTRFHVPDAREAAAAQAFFARALRAPGDAAALRSGAAGLGLIATGLGTGPGMALAEAADDCAGRGAYLLRGGAVPPLAIIAPHRGSDRHTGTIVQALFDEGAAAAAAWNSAPRRPLAECLAAGDVTREETHFLTAFSLAFASVHPHGRIVQFHGFDAQKYSASEGYPLDVVLSNGTRNPSTQLAGLADCLRAAFPERHVAVFPDDTAVLGATGNAQGMALRAAGFPGFVHLELALPLRELLAADPAARAALARCLEQGL